MTKFRVSMNEKKNHYDNIIIGAGAAGLFLAGELKNQKNLVLEKNAKPGKKIIVSGGGRCNFTNKNVTFNDFQSQSKSFYKSALKAYTQNDFIKLIEKNNVEYYEKKLGQLFCKGRSSEVLNLLLRRINLQNTSIRYNSDISENYLKVERNHFTLKGKDFFYTCKNLIIASGGPPMPKIGGSNLALRIAKKLKLNTENFEPALVPLFEKGTSDYSGISMPVEIKIKNKTISDDILFTHRGFSGPSILKLTLWADIGDKYFINWDPNSVISQQYLKTPNISHTEVLSKTLPKRFTEYFLNKHHIVDKKGPHKKALINKIIHNIKNDEFIYKNNEGFNKAEVAKGGLSTIELNHKTMETKSIPGLYFIGEAVDVTGLLGGFNFQWAWSSAYLASIKIKALD